MSTMSSINLGAYGTANAYATTKTTEASAKKNTEEVTKNGAAATDTTATNEKTSDVDTFEKSKESNRLTADQLKAIQDQQMSSFQKMLSSMLTSQAKKSKLASNGLSADLFENLTVTPEQKLAAQQAISEDGEWGVNAVATRIMDMCVALSGGDSSKLDTMRAAVEKGFKEAGGQWGTSLPSICNDTYDEIMKRFDYWEENGSIDGYKYGATTTKTEDK